MVTMQRIVEMSAHGIKSIFGARETKEKSLVLFVLVSKVRWHNDISDYRKHFSFMIGHGQSHVPFPLCITFSLSLKI